MAELSNHLCECGCGARTRVAPQTNTAKGWIRGVPLRFVRGHAQRKNAFDEIEETPDTNCWIWQRDADKTIYAHRGYFEAMVGPIPDGCHLHHVCRNRACVNPGHVVAVTPGMHGVEHQRRVCKYGHELTDANLYIRPSNGQRECLTCIRRRSKAFVQRRSQRRRELRAAA